MTYEYDVTTRLTEAQWREFQFYLEAIGMNPSVWMRHQIITQCALQKDLVSTILSQQSRHSVLPKSSDEGGIE